ncbi:kinase [Corynebacterium striatum]|uniref:Kinase n=1 Tax=Corynebacterium striatum TaxID=43770 RepID=A0A2Z2J870_CORST|nr:DAK2 domain-containing protein [Corynebacterium striatum]ART21388.1 kinase [Corynebacterium striatum]
MSFPSSLDARGLHNWAIRTVGELSHRRAEINALNVFPVPDSDTGSNMAHTMEAALAEVEKGGDVAEALAIGSVRGARGNSGMVLSQVLRGVADSTVDSRVDGQTLAEALSLAVRLVERAIARPVEGTVISVLRAAAAAAEESAQRPSAQLHEILVDTITAAREALEKTPTQLAVLREAGVVDAGGTGFVILLETLLAEIEGGAVRNAEAIEEVEAELEVVFFFEGDLVALEQTLAPHGNSLVVARATEDTGTVHIHTREAGPVIEMAFAAGAVSSLRLEVLPDAQAQAQAEAEKESRTIFAVAPAGPVAALFETVGARIVRPDEVVENSAAQDIYLPNGYGGDAGVARVVPTESLVAGLAAISVYEPDNPDTDSMVSVMRDAARSMRVDSPDEESVEAIIAKSREMLAGGGEQVTILSGVELSDAELSDELDVEVVAIHVDGITTEIGVE